MAKYYSAKEIVQRGLWVICYPLFRLTPRLFYSWRNVILRIFGARIGRGVEIFPSVVITFPWLLEVGDRTVISWGVRIYNLGQITIGSNTVISQHCHLCGGTHDYRSDGFDLIRSGLTIGNNVWIAADAFIGPGVSIADGVVVAARAVVIRDVPSLTVVAGHPAVAIRQLDKVPPMQYFK